MNKSEKQETRTAEVFRGTRNAASGSLWLRKNDVRTQTESIELKTTTKQSYSLKLADLEKAWKIAILDGRRMVFGIEFSEARKRFVVLTEEDYLEITQEERDGFIS